MATRFRDVFRVVLYVALSILLISAAIFTVLVVIFLCSSTQPAPFLYDLK